MTDLEELTLANLDPASALFARELRAALANIADEETDPEQERKIILTVRLKPSAERTSAIIAVSCESKLAGAKPEASIILLGVRQGRHIAVKHDPSQLTMFEGGQPQIMHLERGGPRTEGNENE